MSVCKPDSHPLIEECRQDIKAGERVRSVRRGKQRITCRHQWLSEVPLRGDAAAISINWLSIATRNEKGDVTYRNSVITEPPVGRENVAELAAAGRARWEVEDETFNALKTRNYNLEHNFGSGRQNRSTVLVTLKLPAAAAHSLKTLPPAIRPGRV